MIYFDNAATTMVKPPEVSRAVASAIDSFGGVGRSAHDAALNADMAVYRTRGQIARLLGGQDGKHVAFSLNVTEALNIVAGILHRGDHVITTAASHNSILRPLYRKQAEEGVDLSILPVAPDGSIDLETFDALFQENTRLVMVTHASNLTGDVYDVTRMAEIAHSHGALIAIDAAQTAGTLPIDMSSQSLDIVAFTGHKGLFGPQGTGGLCIAACVSIPAFKVGGSGTHSYDHEHPSFMPAHLEAGTLNGHGIAGLSAGVSFIEGVGVDAIHRKVSRLTERFEKGVLAVPGVRVYGGHGGIDRCGIVSLNIRDVDSGTVSSALNERYGICTRAGAHCAPLMHEALGTREQGQVRFSFSYFNTAGEIDQGIAAVSELAEEMV